VDAGVFVDAGCLVAHLAENLAAAGVGLTAQVQEQLTAAAA
jgi:hypothetical protein